MQDYIKRRDRVAFSVVEEFRRASKPNEILEDEMKEKLASLELRVAQLSEKE